MASQIERELLKATKVRYTSKDDRSEQLRTLARAVNKLADADWRRLSEGAQLWYDKAAEQLSLDKQAELADFSDQGSVSEGAKSAKIAEKSMPRAKSKSATEGNGKAKATAKKAATAKKTTVRVRGDGGGAPSLIHSMLVKNPDLTPNEVYEKLQARGNRASKLTVAAITSRAKDMIRRLDAAGHLKGY